MKSYLGTVTAGDSSQRGKHLRYLTPRGILSWEAWASDAPNRLLTKSLLQLVRRVTIECHPGNLLVNCRQRWVTNENYHRVHARIQPCRQCRHPWTIRWFFVSKYASSQSSGVVIRMSRLPPYRVLCTKMSVNVVNDVHTEKVPGYLSRERFQTVQVVFVSKRLLSMRRESQSSDIGQSFFVTKMSFQEACCTECTEVAEQLHTNHIRSQQKWASSIPW